MSTPPLPLKVRHARLRGEPDATGGVGQFAAPIHLWMKGACGAKAGAASALGRQAHYRGRVTHEDGYDMAAWQDIHPRREVSGLNEPDRFPRGRRWRRRIWATFVLVVASLAAAAMI